MTEKRYDGKLVKYKVKTVKRKFLNLYAKDETNKESVFAVT